MVYFYAALGVMMLSGIMAIFEMGLSLTGQSMIPTPSDEYFSGVSMKNFDIKILGSLADSGFPELVMTKGLCNALEEVDDKGWSLISEGRWASSCQLTRGSHRVIVSENPDNQEMPYALFSCVLSGGNDRCSFERE